MIEPHQVNDSSTAFRGQSIVRRFFIAAAVPGCRAKAIRESQQRPTPGAYKREGLPPGEKMVYLF
jgi:hypothetical protein